MFWGLNIPHLLRREGGIKDEGTGKSMAEWNPAAIELFQLTLTEERGIPKHSPVRSLTPPFRLKLHHFLLPLLTHLSPLLSVSPSLSGCRSLHFFFFFFYIPPTLSRLFHPHRKLFKRKPVDILVFRIFFSTYLNVCQRGINPQ